MNPKSLRFALLAGLVMLAIPAMVFGSATTAAMTSGSAATCAGCKPSPGVEVVWEPRGAVSPGLSVETEIRITPRVPVDRIRLSVEAPAGVDLLGPLPAYDGPASVGETLTFPLRVRAPMGAAPALRARVEVESAVGRYGIGAALDLTPERLRRPEAHLAADGSRVEFAAAAAAPGVARGPGTAPDVARGPIPGSTLSFTGRFLYRDRVFTPAGFAHADYQDDPVKPIRRADVDLIKIQGTSELVVATGSTDDTGAFALSIEGTATDTYKVRVTSMVLRYTGLDLRVRVSAGQPIPYTAVSPSFQKPMSGTDVGDFIVEPQQGGEAFNILDSCLDGALFVHSLTGALPATVLKINWNSASTNGTYFNRMDNSMYLLADEGYDDCVILHEYGHYVAAFYSKDESPGGAHYIDDSNQDPRLSWSEGWASFFQSAARAFVGASYPDWYVDTTGDPGAGQLYFSYACEGPSISVRGTGSEVAVQAALWDIQDNASTPDDTPGVDDDPMWIWTSQIWEVLTGPLLTAVNVSLEDFWNGWMLPPVSNGFVPEMKAVFGAVGAEYYADERENDGSAALATLLPLNGAPVHHTFYAEGDNDYHKFTLEAGETLQLETLNLVGLADTRIELYDPSSAIIAQSTDRSVADVSSYVAVTATVGGTYTVRIRRETKGKAFYCDYGVYDVRGTRGTVNTLSLTALSTGAAISNPGFGVGAAWGDYDNDGDPDCYVVNNTAAVDILGPATAVDAFYQNLGSRSFTNVTAAAGLGNPEGSVGAAWGDYDNDGDLDLFLTGHALYRNTGAGMFTDVTAASGVTDLGREFDAAWVDADADGRLDLFVLSRSHASALWHNNGDGTFTDVAPAAGFNFPADGGEAYACAWGDYDGDRRPDLFMARLNAPTQVLYHNLGDNHFVDVTAAAGVGSTVGAQGASWGDVDNDGRLDLFVASTGANALYVNQGDGTFVDEAGAYGVNDPNAAAGSGFADYDLDGDMDLFVANVSSANLMFQNLGGTMARVGHVAAPSTTTGPDLGCAWADVDGDGDADLYLARGCTSGGCQPSLLYVNDLNDAGTARPWLKVKLQGQLANRDGIGALLVVHAGGHVQTREVGTTTGWASKSRVPELFGFPTGATVDSVQVFWPSRRYNVVRHPTPNTVLTILEDTFTPVLPPETPPPFLVTLRGPYPNPSNGAAGMGFTLTREAQVKVEVFDVTGRRVRVLADGLFEAGDHVAGWDGEDDRGNTTPAGLYFYRLTAEGRTEIRRLVRVSR